MACADADGPIPRREHNSPNASVLPPPKDRRYKSSKFGILVLTLTFCRPALAVQSQFTSSFVFPRRTSELLVSIRCSNPLSSSSSTKSRRPTFRCSSPRGDVRGQRRTRPRESTLVPLASGNSLDDLGEDSSDGTVTTSSERTLGIVILLTVPLAWGTFEPAVRYVYAIKPPIPGVVFSVSYYLVAYLSLAFILSAQRLSGVEKDANMAIGGTETVIEEKDDGEGANDVLPMWGGIELGTYLFVGNALQVLGLKTVSSDRAAFLLQLTTIMVPLVQAAIAKDIRAIPSRTWVACLVALSGVAVMGLDGQEIGLVPIMDGSGVRSILSSLVTSFQGFTLGDLWIVLAAFSYTFHCIRLGRYAKETAALNLATAKAATETALSAALLLGLVVLANVGGGEGGILNYAADAGNEIQNFLIDIKDGIHSGSMSRSMVLPALGAILWTGWITVAYTIYAQSLGQRTVKPAEANLIYTVQPIFTALFAWMLLGETLGVAGYVGGALIGSAVLLVVLDEGGEDNELGR